MNVPTGKPGEIIRTTKDFFVPTGVFLLPRNKRMNAETHDFSPGRLPAQKGTKFLVLEKISLYKYKLLVLTGEHAGKIVFDVLLPTYKRVEEIYENQWY